MIHYLGRAYPRVADEDGHLISKGLQKIILVKACVLFLENKPSDVGINVGLSATQQKVLTSIFDNPVQMLKL